MAASSSGSARIAFDKHSRLRSRAHFDAVFAEGSKVVNRELVARIRPVAAGRPSRLGLSVSRKVGNAPRRNRVKRCLRAAFRELRSTLSGPIDLVLIARPQHAPDSFEAARRSLRDVFRRHARGPRPAGRPGARPAKGTA